MKLSGTRAAAFCARPDAAMAGALLHGPDAGLVALRRREIVDALTGGDDLRLTRLDPGVAQKTPAEIDTALRARGFFPGTRVVLIEGAKDALAGPLKGVLTGTGLKDWTGEAFLVVTASGLAARSALRRLFEGGGGLVSLGLYPESPGPQELEALLGKAGLQGGLSPEAAQDLAAVAVHMDRGQLLQLIEKIALFSLGRDTPMCREPLAALLPPAAGSEIDRLVMAVAEGRTAAVGPLIARLAAAGIGTAGMLILTGRYFRQLLGIAAAPDGIDAALGRLRPPVYGPRRQALAAQARRWGAGRLETANRQLFRTDRLLRSAGPSAAGRPDRALVERCLIRLAMMVAKG